MGRKPFPRNERCPCGGGEKYKRCCLSKGLQFYIDDEAGEVLQSVPLNSDARGELDNALVVQRGKFIAKFGREPGPDDPIFFDLDEDKLREHTAHTMRTAGIRPALIYAYEETGLIVTQDNRRLIPDLDLREFDAKVREYYDLHPEDDPKTS
jgi:SEC-C motif